MNLNSNLLARLMLNQLPGLAGTLQAAGGGRKGLGEWARRQHGQNLANAMLSATSGHLAPSPNHHYAPGPLQRLGAGLGAAMQSYNGGGLQGGILEVLGMDGSAARPRASAVARPRRGGVAPRGGPAQKGPAPAPAPASGNPAPGRIVASPGRAVRKPASRQLKLEAFNGTVARRLEHPAALPGGWKLYGYEQGGGRPVYVGPGRQLRVYG